MIDSSLVRPAWAILVAGALLSACTVGRSVVGGGSDASSSDTPDLVAPLDVVVDVPDVVDAPDVPDVVDAPDVPAGCATDNDCAASAAGPVCDTATGRCVRCSAARDTCPAAQHCDLGACVDGCRSDDGCALGADAGVDGGAAAGVCDTANHRCVACVRDDQCPVGNLCMSQRCVAGCSEARACPTGLTCCGGGCVDVQTSADTCGACGTRCTVAHGAAGCAGGVCTVASCADGYADCDADPANGCETDTRTSAVSCGMCRRACVFAHAAASCAAGACVMGTCDEGFANCDGDPSNGCEADTRTSLTACGACGRACTFAHAAASCTAGACAIGTCDTGFADCNGDPADGCEAPTNTATNCGACGRACAFANAASSCATGACVRGACSTGFDDCDGNSANGCEVTLASDPAHCGTCATTCAFAHAAATCTAGACARGACEAGFGDCDGNMANGCETPTTTTLAHCGACGRACTVAHGTASCAAGACGVAACDAGFANCDGNAANGCETPTAADVSNCGACGRVCAGGANATAVCAAGTCGLSCAGGFGNCDGSAANGCETATVTNAANCGGCGITCGSGFVCAAGRCESVSCPPPATCTGAGCPTTCSRVLFTEDWESGVGRWYLPRGGAEPLTTQTDTSACRGSYLRETELYSAGRAFTRASIPVVPGQTYCVSGWIRGSAGTWPFIGMRNSDATGALGGENWLIGQPCFGTGIGGQPVSPVTSDSAWRWYGRQYIMPAGYNFIVLEIEIWNGGAAGTADFDNVQVIEGPCPTTPSAVCTSASCPAVAAS